MANPPPLTQMQAQFNSLLDAGWGKNSLVTRLSGTADTEGEITQATTILASGERIWIQALAGRAQISTMGLNAETTHLAFQKLAGVALRAKDRILPSGETYVYDVIDAHVLETHRMAQVKRDLRK